MKNFPPKVSLALFDCVSFALKGYAVLRRIYHLTPDLGIRKTGARAPSLDDPKELHGFLASP